MSAPTTAFVLGAGLGTRLRPLTLDWPKPLLRVGGRPVITYAFEQLAAAGVTRFIVNTHHCAERYAEVFPGLEWEGRPIALRHEPVLLETGGGIKNIEDLLAPGEPLLVYNGDIISTLPVERLLSRHREAGNEVTLALRSSGGPLQIGLDGKGRVSGIGGQQAGNAPRYLFSGVYVMEPTFLDRLEAGVKRSVIPTFLEMIKGGEGLGGAVIDEGTWSDIGTLDEFLAMNEQFGAGEAELAAIRAAIASRDTASA
ncbi:MAG: nucleotidyltransferase family protein [Verrucomicrobiota bacterium]